ncbi:hypothetical protein Tco_1274871 [Tanacetum coccineum]
MANSVISVSSDSFEDSVGTPVGRVILFGTIPTTIPDTTPVISPPTNQTDTTVIPTEIPIISPTIPPSPDYTPVSPNYSPTSDTESNPSEDPISDHIPSLPATLLFLSSTNDTIDSDTPDTPPSPTHDSSSEASSDLHSDASFDSSSRHSLSDHFSPDLPNTSSGPSRKRRRSPMTYVPALPPISGALSLDSFEPYVPKKVGLGVDVEDESSEQSRSRGTDIEVVDDVERSDWIDIDPIEAVIEACFDFADIIRASGVDVWVEDVTVARDDVETSMRDLIVISDGGDTPPVVPGVIPELAQEGAVGSTYETLEDLVQRFHDHIKAILVHRIQVIEGVQREQGRRIIGVESAVTTLTKRIAELEKDNKRLKGTASVEMISHHLEILSSVTLLCCRKMPNTRSGASMTHEEIEGLVTRRVAKVIEACEAAMNLEPLNEDGDEQEGENGGNGNGGTEGIESALTWWNTHKKTISVDAAYAMKWDGLMRLKT